MAGADDWQSSEDFCLAVRSFHDRHSRQPSGVDVVAAKRTLEQLKIDIRRQMADQGVFVCSRYEHRGSSYEGVKIMKSPSNDDLEFDLMFVIEGGSDLSASPVPGRPGYLNLKPKPGKESKPLFQKTLSNGVVSASKLRNLFYGHLIKCKPTSATVKYNGPAVRIDVMQNGRLFFSVDLAPHFELESSGIYVPKAPKDDLNSDARFRSYSLQEKNKFDGMDRDNGCRKMILRIMKALRFQCAELASLKSNQLKTILMKEVDAQQSWKQNQLGQRLMDVLRRLEDDLTNGRMNHYYMADVNLFYLQPVVMKNMRDRIRRLRKSKSEMMALLAL